MVKLEMTVADALFALASFQESGARAHKARRLGGVAEDVAEMTAAVYDRLEHRLAEAIYPRHCEWMDNDPCDMGVEGQADNGRDYCRFHLGQIKAQVERLQAVS